MMKRRSLSLIVIQRAISLPVRRQPRQSPSGPSSQMPVHGLRMGVGGGGGIIDSILKLVSRASERGRENPARLARPFRR